MRIVGTASVLRHGATRYTRVFPDLAEEGLPLVKASTAEIARRFPKSPKFISSSAARALGTIAHAMDAYGIAWREDGVEIAPELGPIRVEDEQKAFGRFGEVTRGLTNPLDVLQVWDRFYMEHPDYDSGNFCESRSSARHRFLAFLLGEVRSRADPAHHVVIATHIETIGCAIHQWFGVDGTYFGPGEAAHFEFLANGGLRVEFRGRKMVIAF